MSLDNRPTITLGAASSTLYLSSLSEIKPCFPALQIRSDSTYIPHHLSLTASPTVRHPHQPSRMPTVRGVRCEVLIEGTPIEEYNVHVNPEDGRTASCYVMAESDKQFAIRLIWDTPKINHHLYVRTLIDGEKQQIGFRHTVYKNSTLDGFEQMFPDCKTVKRPWKFVSLKFTEEADNTLLEALGSINIELGLKENTLCSNLYSWSAKNAHQEPIIRGPVREKDIKGWPVSHQVEYGAAQITESAPLRGHSKCIDPSFCKFIIYYRSKEYLQSLGLIPLPPDSDEEEVAAMTPQEMQAELLRLRFVGQRTSRRVIKREEGEAGDDSVDGAHRRRRAGDGRRPPPEVIDLTQE
ncbi:hypothetical protein EDC01DRAFT_743023 [Geopyxis carbonaria]|nr:hypothetical protein EDC01DRAFT_743023 [Geopyxis carbonaria]